MFGVGDHQNFDPTLLPKNLAELWCPAFFFKKNGPSFLDYNEYYEYLNIPLMSRIHKYINWIWSHYGLNIWVIPQIGLKFRLYKYVNMTNTKLAFQKKMDLDSIQYDEYLNMRFFFPN